MTSRRRALLPLAVAAVLLAGSPAARAADPPRGSADRPRATSADAPEPPLSPNAVAHYLRAQLAEAGGDLALARRELDRALAFDASSRELRLVSAELHLRTGDAARADDEARRAVEGTPPLPTEARGRFLLGGIAAARADWPRAARELREAARLERADAARAGRTPRAAPWRALAVVLAQGGDEAGAARALDDLSTLVPAEAAEGYAALAETSRPGDVARDERLLARAAALSPSDGRFWRALARVREAAGRRDAAREAWQAAARADPDDADALLALGRHAARAGDLPGAAAWFRQLLAADADPDAARAAAAFAWIDTGHGEQALELLGPGAPGDDPRLHVARGLALQELRRWPESLDALGRVPRDGGDLDALARERLAVSLAALGRDAEAIALLEAAVAARPRDASLRFALGAAQERAGRADEAIAQMRAVLAIEPDHAEALNFIAYTLAERGEKLDEAEEMMGRALARSPENPAFLDSLGWVHFRKGDTARAVSALERAAALGPPDATVFEHLGDAYRRAGRSGDAAAAYRKALAALAADAAPVPPAEATRRAGQQSGLEKKLDELRATR